MYPQEKPSFLLTKMSFQDCLERGVAHSHVLLPLLVLLASTQRKSSHLAWAHTSPKYPGTLQFTVRLIENTASPRIHRVGPSTLLETLLLL